MAGRFQITLTGDKRFDRGLRTLKKPGNAKTIRRALTRSGKLHKDTIQRHFVSGQAVRWVTGEYHRSFRVKPNLPHWIDIGTPEPRAGPLEFGWPAKNIRKRPHILPALNRARRRFPDIWVEEMDRSMRGVR